MNKLLAIIFILFANSVFAIDIDEAIKSTIEKNPKVKIAYEKLIESGHSSFMKKITPKFSKCRRCGNVLKSHSKRYCGLRCSGIKPRWKEH